MWNPELVVKVCNLSDYCVTRFDPVMSAVKLVLEHSCNFNTKVNGHSI
jgi:hypothetical protein